ncbi:hypothetical protein ABPG77_007507 [Micractinium sp. CCAP 211/92]
MAAEEGQPAQEGPRCQVCSQAAAKYCCPRCDKRTCSLECVKAHKDASGCSGKRDRTAFVGRAEFDERTFLSDYRFLEEVKLADDVAKRSKPPAPKLELPQFLQTLQYQARRRGVQLHILSPGMEKRRTNTTRYDGRMQTLQWHVEWRFPAAEGAKAADHKVHENTLVSDLLRGHLALKPGEAARHHALREYNEAGLDALTVLMRKERTPANAVEYHEIDATRPLRTQLAGKVVVEFPTFIVLLPREREGYTILPAAQAAAAPTTGAVAAHGPAATATAGAVQAAPAEARGKGTAVSSLEIVQQAGVAAGASGEGVPGEAQGAQQAAAGPSAAAYQQQAEAVNGAAGAAAAAAAQAPAATADALQGGGPSVAADSKGTGAVDNASASEAAAAQTPASAANL